MRAGYPNYTKLVFSYMRLYAAMALACLVGGLVCIIVHAPGWVVDTVFLVVASTWGGASLVVFLKWLREDRVHHASGRVGERDRAPGVPAGRVAYSFVSIVLQVFGFLGLLALLAGFGAHINALAIPGAILFGLLLVDISIASPLVRSRRAKRH